MRVGREEHGYISLEMLFHVRNLFLALEVLLGHPVLIFQCPLMFGSLEGRRVHGGHLLA